MRETTGLFRTCLISSIPCLFLVGCRPTPQPVPPGPAPVPVDVAQALLDRCNAYRFGNRLPPLKLDSRLMMAAQSHAGQMARVRRLAHEGIGDGSPFDRMMSAGYVYGSAGECVAQGQADAESVMRAWEGDAPHRAILSGPYSDCGGACARGNDGIPYWCMDFGITR